MANDHIKIKGARQNNLKNLDLELPLGEMVVVTGVSGSGKSSLAFDTVYAEGQRRYVETFSPYARQFLDRMDRPQVDAIEGIPPSIAIDQTNPVRTSRSTVGTMTELNDHLKLLFARAATLFCHGCGRPVERDNPEGIFEQLMSEAGADEPRLVITFAIEIPHNFTADEIKSALEQQGYTRIHREDKSTIEVVQDRMRLNKNNRSRLVESVEIALEKGHGKCAVYNHDAPPQQWKFSSDLHCAACDIHYKEPQPNLFSFNSALGACDTCRGFGRTIGIDWNLVIPDDSLSLREGAIKPFRSGYSMECQEDLLRYGRKRKIDLDTPWRELDEETRRWVIDGEGPWEGKVWYGVQEYFDFLESKAYKMHIRIMLSKYRSYDTCPTCHGARLKDEVFDFRVGTKRDADAVLNPAQRFRSDAITMDDKTYRNLPGLNLHDVMLLPLEKAKHFFDGLFSKRKKSADEFDLLLDEIRSRLHYLIDVGLGYLTLDRQSRTLSGGEVQRINLTTALGTSLVNTLFVLDEPSIGLHPRDIDRINGVLNQLRDAGNSLLVVEHDPQIMLQADRILDIGPGPGERGGEIVFYGTPSELVGAASSRDKKSKSRQRRRSYNNPENSLTAAYLKGKAQVADTDENNPPDKATHYLEIHGASEHNLKDIDIKIPLGHMVTLTGVSGSGKSTLVQDVLFNALSKIKGKPEEIPGAHREIIGHEQIDGVVMLDQAPIGKSSRSNPVSYVGAWDAIRKRFANTPTAKERGYKPGTFSFNSGNGRCPTCNGSGFEHVEMQFLSDVYLRCPDCNGKRYRNEILEVTVDGKSVSDILDLTVTEALQFFKDQRDIHRVLEPLQAVGLSYLRLGQPVPTLSGGEAQRLKLAGYLAKSGKKRKAGDKLLFLLDEPTTGLHFADIAILLKAMRRLLRVGHSLLIIEHNLDVIAASDWLIDLGPEGGDEGGQLVCEGTPQEVTKHKTSHTGKALREYQKALNSVGARSTSRTTASKNSSRPGGRSYNAIEIVHAREHNLKNISLEIPREKFTVVTGVSGSGKSTIAFDILFNEGQRRYLESLNAYARQFVQPASRPEVDAVFGIPPTVAIEQRTSRGGRKSTVGTLTEIHHFLRLLFVKLGLQYCPECQVSIEPQSRDAILAHLMSEYRGKKIALLAPLILNRKGIYKDLAQWADRKGYPILRVDGEPLPTNDWPVLDRYREHNIDLPLGELVVKAENEIELKALLDTALDHGKGTVRIAMVKRGGDWGEELHFSTHRTCPSCGLGFEEPDPRLFSYNSKHGWCESCYGTGTVLPGFDEEQSGEEGEWLASNSDDGGEPETCPSCEGARLNDEALAVYFHEWNISEYAACPVDEALPIFKQLQLNKREKAIGQDVVSEIISRLEFLQEVGLGYLTLDRAAPTLSGGEAQRIRLAAQLGSNLRGVCYILDEPTIGLHPRDNTLLLNTLKKLEGKGNTIVVVEHDEETIRSAEHVIDIGPGAGVRGGEVIHAGTVKQLMRNKQSLTGQFLAKPLEHPLFQPRPVYVGAASQPRNKSTSESGRGESPLLHITGAKLNNLKQLDIDIPLQRLVSISGVSGSGKSTLIREVMVKSLKNLVSRGNKKGRIAADHYHGCKNIEGWQNIQRVLEVDQTPIGKTPRSCPATYVGFWDEIRKLYAQTEDARIHGWKPGRFSFNTGSGNCPTCKGQGMTRVEMSFLPDVKTLCESCHGARFNQETLSLKYREKSIGDVLAMSVDEAVEFFEHHPKVHQPLQLLQAVGLGYLTLGQQSPTLSGGEAQRIKLVTELSKAKPNARTFTPTLYVLDEPTVGLHMADVEKLIRVLHKLVDAGHSVVVIEHNLDIIAEADWCIDLGPEGGDAGGEVVVEGVPEKLVKAWKQSETGKALKAFMK